MRLLYIVFGKQISNPAQASFSIASFLRYEGLVKSIDILTDYPDHFKYLAGLAEITTVTEEELNDWKGPYQFFWRVKIKALQWMSRRYPGNAIVYLDTDTFLYSDPEAFGKLVQQKACMHLKEGPLSAASSKTEKLMWRQVRDKSMAGLNMGASLNMWNAGVVASPNTLGGKEFDLALELCDALCREQVTPRLIEQFALSVALEETIGLAPAAPFVSHYWPNKEHWNAFINQWLVTLFLSGRSFNESIRDFAAFDLADPHIQVQQRNTAIRLHRLVDAVFPPRKIETTVSPSNNTG